MGLNTELRSGHVASLDGLRGVAVAAVVGYHLWPGAVPGGYLGVDLFFVLSGYLITHLLLVEYESKGRIGLGAFMGRRMRRLLPALLLVILAVAVFAASQDVAGQLEQVRRHSLGALAYVANWVLLEDRTSYFAEVGTPSMLRHVWSLAVEEQFYLIWPISVLALARLGGRRLVGAGALVVAVLSATAMAMLYRQGGESRAYFGTDARIFEPLLGALAATILPLGQAVSRRLALAGSAAMLVWLTAVLTVDDAWAGFYRGGSVVLGITASILVIGATVPGGLLSAILGWSPLVWLGEISYGVYLWHWPLLVAIHQLGYSGLLTDLWIILITLSVSWASHRLVEAPVRSLRPRPLVAFGSMGLAAMLVVGMTRHVPPTAGVAVDDAIATAIQLGNGGDPAAAPTTVNAVSPPAGAGASPTVAETLSPATDASPVVPENVPVSVVLIGDSSAWTLGGGELDFSTTHGPFVSPFDPAEISLIDMGRKGYRMIPGSTTDVGGDRVRPSEDLGYEQWWRESIASVKPDLIIALLGMNDIQGRVIDGKRIAFGTPEFDSLILDSAGNLLGDLAEFGRVVWLSSPPLIGSDSTVPDLSEFFTEYSADREHKFNSVMLQLVESDPRITTVDLAGWLCPGEVGPGFDNGCRLTADGDPLRFDGIHFSPDGAAAVAEWLGPVLKTIAAG